MYIICMQVASKNKAITWKNKEFYINLSISIIFGYGYDFENKDYFVV